MPENRMVQPANTLRCICGMMCCQQSQRRPIAAMPADGITHSDIVHDIWTGLQRGGYPVHLGAVSERVKKAAVYLFK